MARVDEDALAGSETRLVFIACNVGEARRAEDVLTQNGVEYCVSFERFIRATMFGALFGPSEHVGVGFTVVADQAALSRDVLARHGLAVGIVDDE